MSAGVWCAAVLLVAGCGTGSTAAQSPVPSSPPSTTSTGPPPSAAVSPALPAQMVGAWSRTEDQAEFAYRFLPDGRFRSVEILSQPRPTGLFEYHRQQDGRAEVVGDRVVLRVSSLTTSRADPDRPEGDYTNRPRTPQNLTYTWRVDGNTLSLRSDDGVVLALDRQS